MPFLKLELEHAWVKTASHFRSESDRVTLTVSLSREMDLVAGYARDERLVPQFAPFVNRTGGATWVVVSRTEDLDPKGRFEPWLTATFRPERIDFTGVRLYRIPPVPGTPDP